MSERKKIGGYSADSINNMACAFMDNGHPEAAYGLFKFLSTEFIKSPENDDDLRPTYETGMGHCAYKMGKFDLAISHFQTAYDLKSDNPKYCFNLASNLYLQRKYSEALAVVESALELGIARPDLKTHMTGIKANSLMHLGNRKAALPAYEEIVKAGGGDNAVYFYRGLCLLTKTYYAEALEGFKEIGKDCIAYADIRSFMGLCANALGMNVQSDIFYREASDCKKILPSFEKDHLRATIMLSNAGKYQESLIHREYVLSRISSKSPVYVEMMRGKAVCLRELGDTHRATETLGAVLPKAFANPVKYRAVFATVAKLQQQQGHFEDAVAHMELFLDGCANRPDNQRYLNLALTTMQGMSTAAGEGGYPFLSQACKENAQLLQSAADTQSKFPVLKPLTLE